MQKNNPIFAETGELLNKEAMIIKELKKIKSIYKDLDLKRKKNAESLMNSAAFMAVSMMELEHIINLKGYTEEYQNGANQKGIKKCSEVEIYNNLAKNYLSYVKQLDDMLQKAGGQTKSDELIDFLTGGG